MAYHPNFRMLARPGASQPLTIYGQTYTPVAGTVYDVDGGTANYLGSNHWAKVIEVGPTASRPPRIEMIFPHLYLDTDLGLVIAWDGAVWRDPVTGNLV